MAYSGLFGGPGPPFCSSRQNGPGFLADVSKHLVVTFLVSLLIFLGSFPILNPSLNRASLVAENWQPRCEWAKIDIPVAQNDQNVHDISYLDMFEPGLMKNFRTGCGNPLDLQAKIWKMVTLRESPGGNESNLRHQCVVQIALMMPTESDNSQAFSNGLTCLSLVCPLLWGFGHRMQRSAIFCAQFQLVQYIFGILVLVFFFMYFFSPGFGPGSCVMYFYITFVPCCGHLGLKTCADIQASVAPTSTSTLTASKPASIVQTGAYEPHPSSVPPVCLTKKTSEPCNSRTMKAESEVEEASGGRQMASLVPSVGTHGACENTDPQGV